MLQKDNRPNRERGPGVRKCIGWSIGLIFVIAAVTIGALVGGNHQSKECEFTHHKFFTRFSISTRIN